MEGFCGATVSCRPSEEGAWAAPPTMGAMVAVIGGSVVDAIGVSSIGAVATEVSMRASYWQRKGVRIPSTGGWRHKSGKRKRRTIKARNEHATSRTHANEPEVTAEGIANAKNLENMPRKEASGAWKPSCTLASDLSSSVGVGDAARFAPTAGSDGAATSSTGADVTSKVVPSLAAAACPGSSIVAAATVQFARSVTNGARRSEHGVRGANGTRKHCRKKDLTDISQNRTPNPDPPQQATQHGSPHQA